MLVVVQDGCRCSGRCGQLRRKAGEQVAQEGRVSVDVVQAGGWGQLSCLSTGDEGCVDGVDSGVEGMQEGKARGTVSCKMHHAM